MGDLRCGDVRRIVEVVVVVRMEQGQLGVADERLCLQREIIASAIGVAHRAVRLEMPNVEQETRLTALRRACGIHACTELACRE